MQVAGCRMQDAGFRRQGAGCRMQVSGFRVQGFEALVRRGGIYSHPSEPLVIGGDCGALQMDVPGEGTAVLRGRREY